MVTFRSVQCYRGLAYTLLISDIWALWRSVGTLALNMAEHQSAQMSEVKNVGYHLTSVSFKGGRDRNDIWHKSSLEVRMMYKELGNCTYRFGPRVEPSLQNELSLSSFCQIFLFYCH